MKQGYRYLLLIIGISCAAYGADSDVVGELQPEEHFALSEENQTILTVDAAFVSEQFLKEMKASIVSLINKERLAEIEKLEEEAYRQELEKIREGLKALRIIVKQQEEKLVANDKKIVEDTLIKAFDKINKLSIRRSSPACSRSLAIVTLTLPDRYKVSSFPEQTSLPHEGSPLPQYLCNLLTPFAYEISPLRGYIMVRNGKIRGLLEKAQENTAIKKLFYALPREKVVHPTNLPSNSLIALSPKLVGKLVTAILVDPKFLLEMPETFFEEWYAAYKSKVMRSHSLKSMGSFRENAQVFLALLKEGAEQNMQGTLDLLLSFIALQADAGDVGFSIQDYAQGLGFDFAPMYYTQDDFEELETRYREHAFTPETIKKELEPLTFYVLKSSKNVNAEGVYCNPFTTYTFKKYSFTGCQENTVRTLMNQLLFNPEKKCLDLSLLPRSIQDAMPQDVKDFIEMYGDLDKHFDISLEGREAEEAYKQEAERAFAKLVEDRPDIEYINTKQGVRYELASTVNNTVNVLRLLFGIDEVFPHASNHTEQLQNLFAIIAPDERITIEPAGDDFLITLNFPDIPFKLTGKYSWLALHADVSFSAQGIIVNDCFVQNIYYAGQALGQFLLGACDISLAKMVGHLISSGILKTKADFFEFFRSYSSGFYQSIPNVFNEEEWRAVFKARISDEVKIALLEAAFEMEMNQEAGVKFLFLAFEDAYKTKNSEFIRTLKHSKMINVLYSLGAQVPLLLLKTLLESDMSEHAKIDFMQFLFERGLSVSETLALVLEQSPRSLPVVIKAGKVDVNSVNTEGLTPLMVVVRIGSELAVEELLKLGARLDVCTKEGETAFDFIHERVHEAVSFFDTLTTEDSWNDDGIHRFLTECTFENVLDAFLTSPKISSADKKRIEAESKLFLKAKEAAREREEEVQ